MKRKKKQRVSFFRTIALAFAVFLIAIVGVQIKKTKEVRAVDLPFIFTAAGDYGFTDESKATIEHIASSGAQFNLALGDLSYNATRVESEFCDMVKARVGETFPFELLSGDHENDAVGDDGYINNFASCLPDRMNATISPSGIYAREYFFDYQSARFILVNPAIPDGADPYDYSVGSNRYIWLRDRIREAKSAGKWVVVGNHANCITVGIKSCTVGTDFTNLLITEGVDLVLMGNEHSYQRSKQVTCAIPGVYSPACTAGFESRGNTYLKGYGTVFLIVGTAGSSLYAVNSSDAEAGYFMTYSGSNVNPTNGYAKIRVAADQMNIEFVPSVGQYTDAFTISVPETTPTPTPVTTEIAAVLMADTTVKQASPTRNYGTATFVEIDGSPVEETLLKFAVGDTFGKQIVGAKLRLYNVNSSTYGGTMYKTTDNSWVESGTGGVTWNTAPAYDPTPIAAFAGVNVNTWYEVDVHSAITGDGTVGFRIRSSAADGVDYASKEGASEFIPQLLVQVIGGGNPTQTLTPTPSPVYTPTNSPTNTPTNTPTNSPTVTPTPSPTGTTQLSIPVEADAFIAKGSPTKNYGATTVLTNDNNPVRHILLKFNVTGLLGRTITGATLQLYNKDPSGAGGEVYTAVNSNWTESGVNWNTAPAVSTFVRSIGPVTGTSTTPVLYKIDVSPVITGEGIVTFRIPMTSDDSADYISKEGTASKRPVLVLSLQ